MGKKFKKLLAAALSLIMLATFCTVPMTASAEAPADETYDVYDEVTYNDLKLDGNSLDAQHTLSSGITFTYDATSPSYSAVLKYRFIAGSKAGVQFSFDEGASGNISYPFGVWIKRPNSDGAGANGAWHLKPDVRSMIDMSTPLVQGTAYDFELGRLKVLTGENAGKYYVYFKVDGELIDEGYSTVDENGYYTSGSKTDCQLSNKIRFGCWGNGAEDKMTATPEPETYDEYDEITYNDLKLDGNSLDTQHTLSGGITFTYDATSPSYSAVLKYRFIAGSKAGVQFSFDVGANDNISYPFGVWIKRPNDSGAGANGAWHLKPDVRSMINMSTPLVQGTAYDFELGRLKVLTGENAGKYYVYFKVDGELIDEGYSAVDENGYYTSGSKTDCQLSNKIRFGCWGNGAEDKMTETPVPEEYEAYDEIGYEDLIDANGNPLPTGDFGVTTSVFTYNKTSETGSVILKYCWEGADATSNFQLGFDTLEGPAMGYMFGVQYYKPDTAQNIPNGKIWLRPSYGPEVAFETPILTGSDYNIEFARLKVKNGTNAGKYYVYLKINDVLIADSYVDADVVGANGDYITRPTWAEPKQCAISNKIFLSFWDGVGGNKIAPYKEKQEAIEHEGVTGDFNNDGAISATDLTTLRKILLDVQDTSEMPEGIADFNKDGNIDILDLIALKKYLAPVNTYAKSGSLTLGMQEHLDEDYTKTAEYIADATATLGATAYRLSMPIHQLYYANSANEAVVREDNMTTFKGMIAALKAKGVTEILYVTDSFILPYGYADDKNHNITVPDPEDDVENYVAWLTVNASAFKALAEEVPEIRFFEPFNEINTTGTRLERYGCAWDATSDVQAAYKFTVKEKAVIMADLCWYISDAVKSVDPANQVTTPSIVVGSNSVIENDFIDEFYKAIESGVYPTNKVLGDKRVDNYFTIVNIHAYPDYTEDDSWLGDNFESNANAEIAEWAGYINTAYDVVKTHNDGGSRVWITETGMSTYHSDGAPRDEDNVARIIELALEKLDTELTFIDAVYFYKIADISSDNGESPSETYFGLFRSGDDLDYPYAAKPSAKAVYSFFHNGTTDYSALDEFVAKYAG